MLEFKIYEREEDLTDLGTITSLLGPEGKIAIIPKNFKDATKRVALVLTKEDGTSAVVACSTAVSNGLRDKTITLGNVVGFSILENEDGIPFISLPATNGAALQEHSLKSLKLTTYVPKPVSYEDLAGL